jgi:hypothetical protein
MGYHDEDVERNQLNDVLGPFSFFRIMWLKLSEISLAIFTTILSVV